MLPLNCQKCRHPFGSARRACVFKACNHYVCHVCVDTAAQKSVCFVCNRGFSSLIDCELPPPETPVINTPKVEKLPDVNKCRSISSQTEPPFKENIHTCAECEVKDSEHNMHLCKTCHELVFEDHEDVKNNVLCAVCVIKKHIRKGHETVDVFPYLSAYNFSTKSVVIQTKSNEFKSAKEFLNNTFSHLNTLSNKISESYDKLTDMAQRSKSTMIQMEVFENMELIIEESKDIISKTESDLELRVGEIQKHLKNMDEWCENKKKNCLNESEIVKLDH